MSDNNKGLEGIEIRSIQESDIPGFRVCLDSVARERKFLAQLEAPPIERIAEFVIGAIRHGDVRIVAVEFSSLIGWCDITPRHWEGLDHVGELGMGVLKEYRRNGIGKNLLEAALYGAQEVGMEKVELDVFASNTSAIELYRKLGFVVEGRRVRSRKVNGEYDDIILMGLFVQTPAHVYNTAA